MLPIAASRYDLPSQSTYTLSGERSRLSVNEFQSFAGLDELASLTGIRATAEQAFSRRTYLQMLAILLRRHGIMNAQWLQP